MNEIHASVTYPFFFMSFLLVIHTMPSFQCHTRRISTSSKRAEQELKVWQLIVGKMESLDEKPLAIPDGKGSLIFPSKSRGGDIFIVTSVICCSCQRSVALPCFPLQLSLTGGSESVDEA